MNIFKGLENELLKIHASFESRANKEEDRVFKKSGMIKNAFDTRRINSEEQVNPRRGLQNYARSEPYITNEMADKIKSLFKVKTAADTIKSQFIGDPDWLDSNSRILCNAIDNTLRIEQKDYDFFKPQFDYLDELLYLRYRLASSDIDRLNEEEIKSVLLKKDEKLMYKSIYSNYRQAPMQIPAQPQLQTQAVQVAQPISINGNGIEKKTSEKSINITLNIT